jgi:Tfp pilus assembly protein PilO
MSNKISALIANVKKDPKQMMIAVSAVVVALLLDLNFLLKPQVVDVLGSAGKLSKVSADLKDARSDVAKIGSMKKAVEAYKEKIGKYEKTLPGERGIPDLLESLSGMAKSANMRIAGIVPVALVEPAAPVGKSGPKGESRAYKEIPIAITAKSGYHELGRFLASLENCDRFMKVSDMRIMANEESPNKHHVDIKVVTYVLLEGG